MSGAAAAPGWYPDPWQPTNRRWWDGATWSGYTMEPSPSAELRIEEEARLAARARVALRHP